MASRVSTRVGSNIRHLREARGLTQQQMARLAEIPRSTWANLESGEGNPTLSVLQAVAMALQVPIDELIVSDRGGGQFYPKAKIPALVRSGVEVRHLLPDPIPGVLVDRMEFPPRSSLIGVPHTPGTREYLACEAGTLVLAAGGRKWDLRAGDVVTFRGDQRHSYTNPAGVKAIGYSVVMFVAVR